MMGWSINEESGSFLELSCFRETSQKQLFSCFLSWFEAQACYRAKSPDLFRNRWDFNLWSLRTVYRNARSHPLSFIIFALNQSLNTSTLSTHWVYAIFWNKQEYDDTMLDANPESGIANEWWIWWVTRITTTVLIARYVSMCVWRRRRHFSTFSSFNLRLRLFHDLWLNLCVVCP